MGKYCKTLAEEDIYAYYGFTLESEYYPIDMQEDILYEGIRYSTPYMTVDNIPDPNHRIFEEDSLDENDRCHEEEVIVPLDIERPVNTQRQSIAREKKHTEAKDILPRVIVSSRSGIGMSPRCNYANKKERFAVPNYNLGQIRANNLRRPAQHRTIDAIPFFKD